MSPNLSRRALVAGAAAASALVPVAAVATPQIVDDPIFAAIEAHRSAEIAFQKSIEGPEDIPEGADAAVEAAADTLLDVSPTTIAGVIALLSFGLEYVKSGREWSGRYLPEGAKGWAREHGVSWETFVLGHAAKALRDIQAVRS